jgi:hypothetical protein
MTRPPRRYVTSRRANNMPRIIDAANGGAPRCAVEPGGTVAVDFGDSDALGPLGAPEVRLARVLPAHRSGHRTSPSHRDMRPGSAPLQSADC